MVFWKRITIVFISGEHGNRLRPNEGSLKSKAMLRKYVILSFGTGKKVNVVQGSIYPQSLGGPQ